MTGIDPELLIATDAIMAFRERRAKQPDRDPWKIVDEMLRAWGWERAKYGNPKHPHHMEYFARRELLNEVGALNDQYEMRKVVE
jgi:hypothetical protein